MKISMSPIAYYICSTSLRTTYEITATTTTSTIPADNFIHIILGREEDEEKENLPLSQPNNNIRVNSLNVFCYCIIEESGCSYYKHLFFSINLTIPVMPQNTPMEFWEGGIIMSLVPV